MDLVRPHEQDALAALCEPLVLVHLLKEGLAAVQQERYAEGAALFAVVRTYLPHEHLPIIALLDAFLLENANYQQVEQELQAVTARFVEARVEQRVRVAALVKPLSTWVHGVEVCREQSVAHERYDLLTQSALPVSVLPQTSPLPRLPHTEERWEAEGLSVTCFGQFMVRLHGQPIALCANRKGQAILRYLVASDTHSATSDTLQALFWPEDTAETAQHKLHIAVSNLRRSFQQGDSMRSGAHYITYKNHVYALNPTIPLHTDVDSFLAYYQQGLHQDDERVVCYERACRLYTGPFLIEDLYADWSSLQRERICHSYISMCSVLAQHYFQARCYEGAESWAMAILKEDRCNETAYRLLIQLYVAQGRRHDAQQQYRICEQVLLQELGVRPLPETRTALEQTYI